MVKRWWVGGLGEECLGSAERESKIRGFDGMREFEVSVTRSGSNESVD